MDRSLRGSSAHGVSQARILEWCAISFSRGSSWWKGRTPCFLHCRWILYCWATREAHKSCALCLYMLYIFSPWFFILYWLIDWLMHGCYIASVVSDSLWPYGLSPPGSSVHGILQARVLEWVTVSSSRRSSPPRDQTRVSCVSCIGSQVPYH